ncbi:FUSC family protein [Duganella violaceipulchra]|uniref:FUSC family protein n=1 Tax=Duganella violaceipulchra TaxID=2849652 RepID=A0AA41HF12_9BURK|nr:FUSC family protein [Duganella violaceicalia]MBV6322493.1 FUSC family protein [Duganella violaceicalia]MCP2010703.1 hypothetical protein [Duganella violaceicalia]
MPPLGRSALVLLPAIACFVATGDPFCLKAGFIGVLLQIVADQARPPSALVLVHGLVIAGLIKLFCLALPSPWSFALLCAGSAALAAWLGRFGGAWRSLGDFAFMSALYSCMAFDVSPAGVAAGYRHLLSWYGLALVPPMAFAWWRGRVPQGARAARDTVDRAAMDAAITRLVSVFLGAAAVHCFHLADGEWLIWSTASVATGSVISSWRKSGDRAAGVCAGVAIGAALSWLILLLLPDATRHGGMLPAVCLLGVAVSRAACRDYRLAIFIRSMLCVVAAVFAGHGFGIGLLRIENVLSGGLIGAAVTLLYSVTRQIQTNPGNFSNSAQDMAHYRRW